MADDQQALLGAAFFDARRVGKRTRSGGDRTRGVRMRAAVRSLARVAFATCAAVLLCSAGARAHDWRRPDLDDWYGTLKRPNVAVSPRQSQFSSCCSRRDCHTTEAELRDGDWWARVGKPRTDGDWDLLDWVRVPPDVVLQQHDNPTGEGVICHSLDWNGTKLNVSLITIWCFVPPIES